MEYIVAALFVAIIILGIIVYELWHIVKYHFAVQVDTQEWNKAKLEVLSSEFKKIERNKEIYSNAIQLKMEILEKKMQDEKIRTEEFVHGVYKDYTNYIEKEFQNAAKKAVNEVENFLKHNHKPVRKVKK